MRRIGLAWLILVILGNLAGAQSTRPVNSAYAAMDMKQISETIKDVTQGLPAAMDTLAPLPTADQQAQAIGGLDYYWSWQGQEMNGLEKYMVGMFGFKVGFIAGDAETACAGARLAWDSEKGGQHNDVTTYCLTWAGVLANRQPEWTEALKYLSASGGSEGIRGWAGDFQPVAKLSAKPLLAKFTLANGQTVDTAQMQGKVIVLYFWTQADQSLGQEIAAFRSMVESYRNDPDFTFYSFNLDGAKDLPAKMNFPWPSGTSSDLRGRFIQENHPLLAVVSAKGTVIWQGLPVAKDTITWVTAFALRQAAYLQGHTIPATVATSAPAAAPAADPAQAANESAADQQYRQALMQIKAGQRERGKQMLEEVLVKYPRTPAAEKAAKSLELLR